MFVFCIRPFKVKSRLIRDYITFESICIDISYSPFLAYFMCLYRPGQPVNFFEEYQDLRGNVATLHSEFKICGDFNKIDVDAFNASIRPHQRSKATPLRLV